jgi:hypothetical protein
VQELAFENPKRVAFADFDGDDFVDIVLASPTKGVQVFLIPESGSPTLVGVPYTTSPEPSRAWAVATGDVNGDQVADLVVGWEQDVEGVWKSRVSVLLGQE